MIGLIFNWGVAAINVYAIVQGWNTVPVIYHIACVYMAGNCFIDGIKCAEAKNVSG